MSTNAKPKPEAKTTRKPQIFIPPEKRCAHRTQQGAPCRAARWRASRFCIFHDPNFRKLRKHLEERRKSAGRQTPMRTPEGIHQMLEDAAKDVREKRISHSEAGIIGYLGQVMISNLKNLPPADDPNVPSKAYTDYLANNWVELVTDKVNEEIARWIPDSSPLAVAKAEHDVVQVAADASAAEAQAAGEAQKNVSAKAQSPEPSPSPWPKDMYDP